MGLIFKAIAVWLVILLFAVANGALREAVLVAALGRAGASVASGVSLAVLILAITLLLMPWIGRLEAGRALGVGALWVALTLAFEFGFGRLVQRQSWRQLLGAYTFQEGNIWPLVLVVVFVAPWLAGRLRTGKVV